MRFGWAELGGSDAHSQSAIGSSFTTFPGHTAEDVLAAIRACATISYGKRWPKKAISYYTYRKVRSHIPTPRAVSRSVGKRVGARIRRIPTPRAVGRSVGRRVRSRIRRIA